VISSASAGSRVAPAEQIAAAGLAAIHGRQNLDSQLEGVIIGTVLGDTLLAALRRLAAENASARATPRAAAGSARRPAG